MNTQEVNFEDLKRHYASAGAKATAETLKCIRSGKLAADSLDLTPIRQHVEISRACLFTPAIELLRFYGLIEIALIGKFIPEPDYLDPFWKETAENLADLLTNSPAAKDNYPTVLPHFLLGRLEGRMHLEEEGIDARYADISNMITSFASLVCQWQDPNIYSFLQFVLSDNINEVVLDTFKYGVGNMDTFMSQISIADSHRNITSRRLIQGMSRTLEICENLNHVLEDSGAFPLLQSAMWTYHADLLSPQNSRLPAYLIEVVETFQNWVAGEGESERVYAVYDYVESVREFINKLASGAYGNSLRPEARPLVTA